MTSASASTTTPAAAAAVTAGRSSTLPGLLLEHAAVKPAATAMRRKELGRWRATTWHEFAERAAAVGLGLRALGMAPGDRVAIHAGNRPEWLVADLGIQGIGGATVGIYPTSPAAEVEYLLAHSESRVLIAEDEEQLDKAWAVRDRLPRLEKIVVVDTRGLSRLDDVSVMTLAELEALGRSHAPAGADLVAEFARAAAAVDPAAPAIVCYTSGTTGPPKGAVLSHANLMAAARAFSATIGARADDEVLSYLPLCHVAERLNSEMDALWAGYTVNFGEAGESFGEDLREVQPTIFLAVPRVWEKMMAGVQIRMADASLLKRAAYRFARTQGQAVAAKQVAGQLGPWERVRRGVAWALVFRQLRDKLGLGRVRVALSGAAPIAPQVLEFFWAMGVSVLEVYGQTEGTAMATCTRAGAPRVGKVGTPLDEVELRIAPDGEILVRSPGVFVGYLNDDAATTETVDLEGWLHTGDIGELDADGYLAITDRKKDIIITTGGKSISPSQIENLLKASPWVREAIIVGDRRRYLTALLGIEADTVGDWATRQRIAFTTYADLSRHDDVRALVQGVVDEVNGQLAQVSTIKRFALLPNELAHEDDTLTATQKVKRAAIAREYHAAIEEMYA
jgi:long-chain acyl-CoA synthetase